jgi:hypothetical protein
VSVGLDDDDIDISIDHFYVAKNACTDAAARAVLKKQHGPNARLFYSGLQLIESVDLYEV